MPVFAQEFGYLPAEFRSLTYRDFAALSRHLNRQADARKAASHG